MPMNYICPWLPPSSQFPSSLFDFVSSLNSNRLVFLLLNSLILLLAATSGALTRPNNAARRRRRSGPISPSSPDSKRRSSSDPSAIINPSSAGALYVAKPSPLLSRLPAGSYALRASSAAMRHAWQLMGVPLPNDEDAAAVDHRAEHVGKPGAGIRTWAGMDHPQKQYYSSVKHGDGEADEEEESREGGAAANGVLLRSEPTSPKIESPYKKSVRIKRSASVNGSPTNKEGAMEEEEQGELSNEDLKKKFDDFIHKTKSRMINAHAQH